LAHRKRRKKRSPASVGYTVAVLGLMAAIVFVGFSVLGRFAPSSSREYPATVLVLNGCGVEGLGLRTARFLRQAGFDVVDFRNADTFNYHETIVVDRAGDIESAARVAKHVVTANVIRQIPETPLVDVVVVVGPDYDRFLPRAGI